MERSCTVPIVLLDQILVPVRAAVHWPVDRPGLGGVFRSYVISRLVRSLLLVAVIAFSGAFVIDQHPQSNVDAVAAPIPVPTELQMTIRNADLELQNAQLKRANLDLQVRLLLKVPNEYQFNEKVMQYEPPAALPKKGEPKKDDKK